MYISNKFNFQNFLKDNYFKTIIIDFDGVVVNSEPVQAQSYKDTLASLNISIDNFSFEEYIGKNEKQIWENIKKDFSIDYDIIDLYKIRNQFLRENILKTKPNYFIEALLLHYYRISDIVLVSSGGGLLIQEYLSIWDLDKYFTSQYLSLDSKKPINKKEVLINLFTTAQKPILIIEDSFFYIELGREYNVQTLWIKHQYNTSNTENIVFKNINYIDSM